MLGWRGPLSLLRLSATLVLVLCPAQRLGAQAPYEQFRFFRYWLSEGVAFEGRDGRLSPSSLEGRSLKGEPLNVPRGEITQLEIANGTESGRWALYGAGGGLLITGLAVLAAWARIESGVPDEQGRTSVWEEDAAARALGIGVGLTLAGAITGGILGAKRPQWRPYPLSTAFAPRPDPRVRTSSSLVERR